MKVSQATLRQYELREGKAWEKAGWKVTVTWKQAIFIGPGKLITKPKDFFDAFDVMAVHVGRAAVAFVQVTASPFVQERSGKADRNAAHGTPPFAFDLETTSVDAWMQDEDTDVPATLGTAIVSYADPRKPERRWWTATPSPPPPA